MGRRGPKPKFSNVACPNEDCHLYGVVDKGNVIANGTYCTKSGRVRKFICHACGRVFCSRTDTAFYDLRTEDKKVLMALRLALDGRSLRTIAKVLDVKAETVSRWLSRAAEHSEEVNKMLLKDLDESQVQDLGLSRRSRSISEAELDELWTVVRKNKHAQHVPDLDE